MLPSSIHVQAIIITATIVRLHPQVILFLIVHVVTCIIHCIARYYRSNTNNGDFGIMPLSNTDSHHHEESNYTMLEF